MDTSGIPFCVKWLGLQSHHRYHQHLHWWDKCMGQVHAPPSTATTMERTIDTNFKAKEQGPEIDNK